MTTAACLQYVYDAEIWLWVSLAQYFLTAAPRGSAVVIAVPLLPCATESKTADLTAMRDFEYRDEYFGLELSSVVGPRRRLAVTPRIGTLSGSDLLWHFGSSVDVPDARCGAQLGRLAVQSSAVGLVLPGELHAAGAGVPGLDGIELEVVVSKEAHVLVQHVLAAGADQGPVAAKV